MRTDTQLLDALQEITNLGGCPGVINDDNGHWAVTGDGIQSIACGEDPVDVNTTFFVQASQWKKTVREAINAYVDEYFSEPKCGSPGEKP